MRSKNGELVRGNTTERFLCLFNIPQSFLISWINVRINNKYKNWINVRINNKYKNTDINTFVSEYFYGLLNK